jgi:2-dehydro-3-deoxyphosphogluconate aldolase/(4S)-4-hydroxy-2-oxoglutarate aldolase
MDPMSRPDVLAALATSGVVPVVTFDRAADAVPVGAALLAGGLTCMEVTFRTGAAPASIADAAGAYPGMLVGAGTVMTRDQARIAVEAGARFIFSPGFAPGVADVCRDEGVPLFPGVMTPTEVMVAVAAGFEVLKYFPAEAAGGVAALRSIGAACPGIRFVPTGGVSSRNLATYLRQPMVAAVGGSWIATRDMITTGDFDGIEHSAAAAAEIVRRVREEK